MNRTLLAMSLRLVVLLALAAPMETAVADFANESKVINGMAFTWPSCRRRSCAGIR